ncbi:MAG: hypothetical protein LH466_09520 [Sphingomonas bacterium]|nr:hypothetical protein [Sphingomonas bacterium]
MPSNRSLNISVNFTGTQANDGSYGGTVTYTQTQSSPPMPGLVDINGNINLDNLPGNSQYNWAIGMNFTLNATVTDRNGNTVPCAWADNSPGHLACAITGPGGGAANGMTVSPPSSTQLSIADANNDQRKSKTDRTYTYKLGVMLPSVNNYFISLDPTIINTGTKVIDEDEDKEGGDEDKGTDERG